VRYALYTLALAALAAGYAPVALYRRLAQGVPTHLRERLGLGGPPVPQRPVGWIHAVSVGEALGAVLVVAELRRRHPGLPLVVTTVTETGARIVEQHLAAQVTHLYFPLDVPAAVRRLVRRIDPLFLVCMETEIWPNTFRVLGRRGVPIMLANGRLSDRSFRRYRLARRLLRPLLADVRVFAMQSEMDARRVIELGAAPERVFVTGNIKHEARVADGGPVEVWRRLLGLGPTRHVWIAGSTHRGEEAAVLQAHRQARAGCPDLALIVAPRHPERAEEVMALARGLGWRAVRRTALPGTAADHVVVLDTIGELARLHGLADVVFIGGSLVPGGGHNVLEPALAGRPVLFGPHTTNFRQAASLLLQGGGGAVVRDGAELGTVLARLLADEAERVAMGQRAHAAAASIRGAVGATVDLLERQLLGTAAGR